MTKAFQTPIIALFFFTWTSVSIHAQQTTPVQTKFKVTGFSHAGYEHNLFYSPTSLRQTNGNILGKDSLIRTGGFGRLGYTFSLSRRKRKNTFSIKSNGYYKNYFAKKLRRFYNQNLDLIPFYQYNFKKTDYFRFETRLTSNKMTRALALDEESIYPFSYMSVRPEATFQKLLFRKISTRIHTGYEYRKYKESTKQLDFTYNELFAGINTKYRHKVKSSVFLHKIGYDFTNRRYANWSSKNQQGNASDTSTNLNRWTYHRLNYNLSIKLNQKWVTGLSLGALWKKDDANADFGFNELLLGVNVTYKHKAFVITANSTISQRKYTQRKAHVTSGQNGPLLVYNYLNARLSAEYKLTKRLSINTSFITRIRQSNSKSDTRITRRNYMYYSVMGGVSYTFQGSKIKKRPISGSKK